MKISEAIALVTGANGGIGQALVHELLERGARKVYAAARNPETLAVLRESYPDRIVVIKLDVTDVASVKAASKLAHDVNLLINNAGFSGDSGALASADVSNAKQEMDVNYFGPLNVSRAFAPVLNDNNGGALVNVLSFLSLVALPLMGTYSASKAAALSLTHSLRCGTESTRYDSHRCYASAGRHGNGRLDEPRESHTTGSRLRHRRCH